MAKHKKKQVSKKGMTYLVGNAVYYHIHVELEDNGTECELQ